MLVLGVPHIVVLKPVDVDLEPIVSVEVHVGNEESCAMPSMPPSFDLLLKAVSRLNRIQSLKAL